jgi:L-gulonate 5-dehydrogenase
VAFETAGQSKALETCIRFAAFAGRVIVVGHSKQPLSILGSEIVFKELDVLGSRNSQGQMPRAMAMLADEPEKWARMISHRFPFTRARDAFRLTQDDGEPHSKIVVDFPD